MKNNQPLLAIGTIDHLKSGWAIIPFRQTVHYWRELKREPQIGNAGRVRFYRSLCGIDATTDDKLPAIVPGNFPKCKRCMKKA